MGLVNRLTEKHDNGLFSVVAPANDPLSNYVVRKKIDNVFYQDLVVVHYQLFDLRDEYSNELFVRKRDELLPNDFLDFGPADASDAYDADEFDDFDEHLFGDYEDDLLDPEDDFDFLALFGPLSLASDCLPELISRAGRAGVELYESVLPLDDVYEDPVDEVFDAQVLRYVNAGLDAHRSERALASVEYDVLLMTEEQEVYSDRLYTSIESLKERCVAGEGIEQICSEVIDVVAQSPLLKQQAARVAQQYFPGAFETLTTQFTLLEMASLSEDYRLVSEVRKSLHNELVSDLKKVLPDERRGK